MSDRPLTDVEVEETRRNPYPPPWGQPNVNIAHLARDLQRARELASRSMAEGFVCHYDYDYACPCPFEDCDACRLYEELEADGRKWRGE